MSNTSKLWLTISLSLVGGIIVGAAIFFGWYFFTDQDQPAQLTVQNVTTQTEEAVQPDETREVESASGVGADWRTYTSDYYSVEFEYPPEWGIPEVTEISGEGDSLFWFPEEAATFATDGANEYRSVRVALREDIQDLADPETDLSDIDTLLRISTRGRLESDQRGFVLPYENASLVATSEPEYVESEDGTFRGIAFYSFTAQGGLPGEPALLPELRVIVTDGEQIVSFFRRSDYTDLTDLDSATLELEPEGDAVALDACLGGEIQNYAPKSCVVDSVLMDELQDEYLPMLETLRRLD